MPGEKPKPGNKFAAKATSKTIGKGDAQSRAKADNAAKRADEGAIEAIPLAADGKPLVMVEMAAAELVPTGQYANVSIGPARIRMWIDPREDDPFPEDERERIAQTINAMAELVEGDVIAVQRSLVMENIAQNVSEKE